MSDDDLIGLGAARRELDEAIGAIRGVPGFGSFLAPPGMDEVAVAARYQPLVYLAAAEAGGLAMVVRGEDVEHVPLPGLTGEALRGRVARHLELHGADKEDTPTATDSWRTGLDDVTRWLWTAVMEPVLGRLRADGAATLVAGGLLGLLPLHAAWTRDTSRPTGRRYALDESTLTYVPNARALTAARELAEGPVERLFTVADPAREAGSRRLDSAGIEALVAAAAFPGSTESAGGTAADVPTVSAALGRADVAHLACHGEADLMTPLESRLLLSGTDALRLRDLLALRLRLRLAVLSACETSVPGDELPDEVVSLPTGLLQAGAAGVIGALWEVPDQATAMLMTEFYRRWRHQERPVPPPTALREAQIWLRDTTNGEKLSAYRKALAEGAGWLPEQAADEFTLLLELRGAPDERLFAGPDSWAGFAYSGV
ncbi:CHAT domain-containing protein [Streptomyces griseoruber]|uniref:CHAT domain-containing protein n=1 Tax=Streptomyces griseoruber TaxID=1943 RepID=UPI0037BD1E2F